MLAQLLVRWKHAERLLLAQLAETRQPQHTQMCHYTA